MSLMPALVLYSCDRNFEEEVQEQDDFYSQYIAEQEERRAQQEEIRRCQTDALANPIISDQFEIVSRLDGTDLFVRIETDLPDFAEVYVNVDRVYYQGSTEYSFGYYFAGSCAIEEFCTIKPENRNKLIGHWRSGETIVLDNDVWETDLRQHHSETQAVLENLGSPSSRIDRIEEEKIAISAVVHLNQEDCRFGGQENYALTGAAVTDIGDGRNVIRAEKEIVFPLN